MKGSDLITYCLALIVLVGCVTTVAYILGRKYCDYRERKEAALKRQSVRDKRIYLQRL